MNKSIVILLFALLVHVSVSRLNSQNDYHEESGEEKDGELDFSAEEEDDDSRELEETSLSELRNKFENFIFQYNKVYLTKAEKERRFETFIKSLEKIDQLNKHELGTAEYGITEYADWTEEEIRERLLTFRPQQFSSHITKELDDPSLENIKIPRNFDWRQKGAVTPVKNQGFCGSCWAFSAVANLESLYYRKHKKLELFSEQQLVDCDTNSEGCSGGWMASAVEYVKKAGGLEKAEDYPYVGINQICSFNKSKAVLKVKENVMLPKNEQKMAAFVFKTGPISIALDAKYMMYYQRGVAHPLERFCSKNETAANHGIAITGYGLYVKKVNGRKLRIPYWIAKNSWGPHYGMNGYFYIYRGDNSCGVANFPSSAVLV